MKAFATILIILVLFLVGQPVCSASRHAGIRDQCCEQVDCDDEDELPADDHESGCAGCNPFQSCSCCVTGLVIPGQPQILLDAVPPAFVKLTLYAAVWQLEGRPQPGVWQPPRRA